MTIYLARHGQDFDNLQGLLNGRRDRDLTPLGYGQAKQLAENLAGKGISRIFCSPLKRACQTAKTVADSLGIGHLILPKLRERDYGKFSGQPVALIPELMAKWGISDHLLAVGSWNVFLEGPRVETFPHVLIRAKNVLAFLDKFHRHEVILLVSHTDMIKMLIAAHFSRPWIDVLKEGNIANTEFIALER
jgi:broad specificity phosphatase PhoE